MRKRESGIDLLRCLGLFFVVGVHSFLKNGYYSEPQTGAVMWAANSWRWLFFCCNGIFMMLTGYLKTQKPFGRKYYKSLIPVLISYVIVSLISCPIRHFLLGEAMSPLDWISNFITFGNYAWYLEMYIGLLLISPLINLALDSLRTSKKQLALTGVLVLLTAVPSITPFNVAMDYWASLYPVTYYMIGAMIKRLQPKVKFWQGGLLAAGTAMFLGLVSLLSNGFSQGYGGFYITLITTGVFLAVYRLQIPTRLVPVLAWAADGVLPGYLLSRLLDLWVYNLLPQWHTPEKYPLLFVCVTIPIYCVSLLAGRAVHALTVKCMSLLDKKVLTKV